MGMALELSVEFGGGLAEGGLHFRSEHVGFVDFDVVDAMAGSVWMQAPGQRAFQGEWRITSGAHILAVM